MQFAETKHLEWKSWIENGVFDLVDLRKVKTEELRDKTMGTHHQDRQAGQLPQDESQMGTARFPKQAEGLPTDRFPASTRPGFRMSCQMAASKSWDLFHIDLNTAFLQRQS